MAEEISIKDLWDLIKDSKAMLLYGFRFYAYPLKRTGYLSIFPAKETYFVFGVYGNNDLLKVLITTYPNYKIAGNEYYVVDTYNNIDRILNALDKLFYAIPLSRQQRKMGNKLAIDFLDTILIRK